jgi:hypothetical protein
VVSTLVVVIAFTKGVNLLYGSRDVQSHLYWAVGALFGSLTANLFAIMHAAQSDRIIRQLRAALTAGGTAIETTSGGQHGKDL